MHRFLVREEQNAVGAGVGGTVLNRSISSEGAQEGSPAGVPAAEAEAAR